MLSIKNITIAVLAAISFIFLHSLIKFFLKNINRKIFTCIINKDVIRVHDDSGKLVMSVANNALVQFRKEKPKKIVAFGVINDANSNGNSGDKLISLAEGEMVNEQYYSDLVAGMLMYIRSKIRIFYRKRLMNVKVIVNININDDEIKSKLEHAIKYNRTLRKLMDITIAE